MMEKDIETRVSQDVLNYSPSWWGRVREYISEYARPITLAAGGVLLAAVLGGCSGPVSSDLNHTPLKPAEAAATSGGDSSESAAKGENE